MLRLHSRQQHTLHTTHGSHTSAYLWSTRNARDNYLLFMLMITWFAQALVNDFGWGWSCIWRWCIFAPGKINVRWLVGWMWWYFFRLTCRTSDSRIRLNSCFWSCGNHRSRELRGFATPTMHLWCMCPVQCAVQCAPISHNIAPLHIYENENEESRSHIICILNLRCESGRFRSANISLAL